MKSVKDSLEELKNTEEFKKFNDKYPKNFFCTSFFIFDYESNNNIRQLDFFIPEKNRIATFFLEEKIFKINEEDFEKKPKEIDISKIYVDTNLLEEIVKKIIEEKKINKKLNKIIAVLHKQEKILWTLTCMFESFDILKIKIDAETSNVIEASLGNLFDFLKFEKKN